MKYGLIVFNKTANIGDDIQSYAAKQFLPRVDYYIEREELNEFVSDNGEVIKTIMSGWYTHEPSSFPPSPFLDAFITSIHLSNHTQSKLPEYLHGIFLDYLKNSPYPIGSRDQKTLKALEFAGISTKFSGCLTLTIKPLANVRKKKVVYAVDVSNKIVQRLKEVTEIEVEVITHALDSEKNSKLPYDKRMKNVEELLKKFQSADLVVTSRLHCCLPALAVGGNPTLIYDSDNPDVVNRLSDYLPFVDHFSEEEFLALNKTEVLERHNNNRQSFKEIASELEKDVTEFLKRDSLMSRPNISPSQYKEFFVKQKKYLIHTQKIETGLLNNRIADMEAYIELLKKENEQLDNQLRILEKRTGVALVKKILRKDREDKNSSRG
ncbi:MAG: polysaccharide pyruvyl transferase family protein [Candidatus Nanosyncoccaceae bacterium]|jgi:hypothetical protein